MWGAALCWLNDHPAVVAAWAQEHVAFGLGEAAPDAVRFGHLKRVTTALSENWALAANRLGAVFALGAGAATLSVGVEENC